MTYRERLRAGLLSATILTGACAVTPALAQQQMAMASTDAPAQPGAAVAEDEQDGAVTSNEIVVTGTRRSISLQDAPINIQALGGEALADNRLDDVTDIAAFTPGLTAFDTGPRTAINVVLRGITSSGAGGSNRNTAIGIYLGEIPLYVDFKLLDLNRVETLLGPQGTLYGLGTLAGAVRYIPNRPDMNDWKGEGHLRYYGVAHSASPGVQADGVINIPIVQDKIAFRSVVGYYNDPGFIDYPLLVRQLGVSLPQPNFNDPVAVRTNLRRGQDLNNEITFTTRNQLAFDFGWLRPTFSYIHQETSTNGDQANGAFGGRLANGSFAYTGGTGVLGTGRYENPGRVPEPSRRKVDLFAGEFELDFGNIAQLVSATAYSKQKLFAQSDIADLLLDLDYDYELFPAFAGTTTADTDFKQFNQELRLVSTHGGPLNWVIGGFYNQFDTDTFSAERLPGFPEFAAANSTGRGSLYGTFYQGLVRPDGIEYISFTDSTTKEYAAFGEATFHLTPKFQVTGGIRYFTYKARITGGTDTPLTSGGRRRTPYPLVQFDPSRVRSGTTDDDGFVYKANASYEISPELFAYATYSTGYRIGGVNRVAPCAVPLPAGQNVCALPNELFFGPDRTTNYEIGMRFQLFDRMLSGSVDIYQIDWKDLQLGSQTVNGAVGITSNASAARNKGVEANVALKLGNLSLGGNYTYLDAKLTEDAPLLIDGVYDGFKGDRLPGTSKHAGSITGSYSVPLANDAKVTLLWTTQARSNSLSKTGNRGFGETIPGFSTSRGSISYERDNWEASVFSNNIFNKYAVVSVAQDYSKVAVNDGVTLRYYGYGVIQPRVIGGEFRVKF